MGVCKFSAPCGCLLRPVPPLVLQDSAPRKWVSAFSLILLEPSRINGCLHFPPLFLIAILWFGEAPIQRWLPILAAPREVLPAAFARRGPHPLGWAPLGTYCLAQGRKPVDPTVEALAVFPKKSAPMIPGQSLSTHGFSPRHTGSAKTLQQPGFFPVRRSPKTATSPFPTRDSG
jgi:hypothetical protein